jgi:tetratricopeptide (TPR) repeat protein
MMRRLSTIECGAASAADGTPQSASMPVCAVRSSRRVAAVLSGVLVILAGARAEQPASEARVSLTPVLQFGPPEGHQKPPGQKTSLAEIASRMGRAVVILRSRDGVQGSGFIISRQHRLVVTAGHMADRYYQARELYASLHGAPYVYRVDRVWYHPRTARTLDIGLVARSFEPADGEIDYPAIDMAVLQLSANGAPLPEGCEVQIKETGKVEENRPVGILGFWTLDYESWPSAVHLAPPDFALSLIRRAASKAEQTESSFADYFYCYGAGIEGASGGPVFAADGKILGIVASGDSDATYPGRNVLRIVRIDRIGELVCYHKLEGVLPIGADAANSPLGWGPDPHLVELRHAAELTRRATFLRKAGSLDGAVVNCNAAASIAPKYAGALLERGTAYLFFLGLSWQRLAADDRLQYSTWALSDCYRANELAPESNLARQMYLQSVIYHAAVLADPMGFRHVVSETNRILGAEASIFCLTEHDRSFLNNLRAQAHHFLHDFESAEKDYTSAIRLGPKDPRWYLNRAKFWDDTGQTDRAKSDRLEAARLRLQSRNF